MRRREFITLLASAMVGRSRRAQPQQIRRIGVLMAQAAADPEAETYLSRFTQALPFRHWSAQLTDKPTLSQT